MFDIKFLEVFVFEVFVGVQPLSQTPGHKLKKKLNFCGFCNLATETLSYSSLSTSCVLQMIYVIYI